MQTKEQIVIESIREFVELLSKPKDDENHIQQAARITAQSILDRIRSTAKLHDVDLNEDLPFE